MEKIRIGIDLGTTNTLACYMRGGKPDIIKFPGGSILPSILYLEEDGTVLIGEKARKKGIIDPLNSIRSSKTEMGNFGKVWDLRGRKYTPTDVASEILKEVRKGIIKKTKSAETVEIEAVITVPAYFTSNQIDETKKAGEMAGLTVLGIVTEPRAAAIANIKELGMTDHKIFVVDLGGGTFDVSVLEANRRQYRTIAVDGDRKLGGDDFDDRLFEHLKHFIEDDLGIDLSDQESSGLSYNEYYSMLGRVREEACQAKVELSDEEEYNVSLPNLFPYKDDSYSLDFVITRDEFYNLCGDLFEKIRDRIHKVFEDSRDLEINEIDSVILAGGSCYIPKIKKDVEDIFGLSADTTMDRSTMVVIGACFIADTWDDVSGGQCDIISHSLGIEALNEDGELILSKLLNRGETYPCRREQIFTTARDNQEVVSITIYEAGSDKEDTVEIKTVDQSGNIVMVHDLYGSFELTGIEKAGRGIPQIKVTFDYDRSRLLTVTAEDMKTGAKKSIAVTKGKHAGQTSHAMPVDFVLLVDTSFSMVDMPLSQAKTASVMLVNDIIDLHVHRLGIVGFGSRAVEISPLSHNKEKLISCINQLEADGSTDMTGAIRLGRSALEGSKNRKVLMLVTDGGPDNRKGAKNAANEAKEAGLDIITIAAGNGADKHYLVSLATSSKFAFSIENMGQLSEIFKTAVAQYLAEIDG